VNRETLNNYEARLRCKDGSIRHVLINSNVLWKDGKFVRTRCFTRDITERRQAEEREREHQKQVATELADMRRLQEISSRLIQEHNGGLYDGILDAAISLLRSDMATMQMFDPTKSQLRLLGARGFDPADIGSFEWVGPDTGTSCAAALRTGRRVVIPDIETCELVVGTPAQEGLRKCGIRSAQSTPLIARTGELIGMITNHWREPHEPTERELLLIDVLARQAADLIERKRNEEQIVLLAREAEHRAKNVLATVQATVHLTQSETPEGLKRAIEGRIGALANVHRLFVQSRWTGAELHALVAEEIAPYSQYGETRVHIDGPNLFLEPNAAQTIAVTLHELTTNAAKYGALSVPNGHVQIGWSRAADGRLIFRWTETGGPRVKSPTRKGFGTRVMDGMIRGQAKGELRFDWHADGLACEFILPICE
jgi:two-component sensor histidine kinase